jgi:hypothetical protein
MTVPWKIRCMAESIHIIQQDHEDDAVN